MSRVAITESHLEDIADAIRTKNSSEILYKPSEMAAAILALPAGSGIIPTGTINISSNGTHNVYNYANANVNVPNSYTSSDEGKVVSSGALVSQTSQTYTSNNTYDTTTINSVTVNVPTGSTINNQNKTVNPSTSQQSITYDSGYTGLGTVTVTAMPALTLPTSTSASATSGYTSKATISRSTSDQYINIGTGYNSTGGYYKISAIADGSVTPGATKGTVSNNQVNISVYADTSAGYVGSGRYSGSSITVSASELVSGNKAITANGTNIDVTNYATVSVAVPTGGGDPTIDSLTVTPSESEQIFNSSSVDGYKPVTVSAISSTYIGSGITQRSSTDLTASGATVTVPAGYYSAAASKSIDNASLGFDSITSNEPNIGNTSGKVTFYADVNVHTASTSTGGYVASGQQTLGTVRVFLYSDISYFSDNSGLTTSGATVTVPAGYYSSSVSKSIASGSVTAPSSISGTSATVSTGTNTLTLTKTVSVTPNVTTAGYISSGTAGNSSVSLTASVTTKAAATITPGTSSQTIASGTYLTGTQTIAGDANLVASNIVSGVSIFGVSGSVVLQNVYTGSSAPSSSTGSNGDIYIQG